MRYNILNFSQSALVEYELNEIDVFLLTYFERFSLTGRMKTFTRDDGEVFFWVSYKNVLSEFPFLSVSNTQSIARRFKRLAELEILEHWHCKKGGSWATYRLGKNYPELDATTAADPISTETDPISTETDPVSTETDPSISGDRLPMSTETDPLYLQRQSKDPITNNPITNNPNTNNPKRTKTTKRRKKVKENNETMLRINSWFGRRPTTLWSVAEKKALDEIDIDDEELELLEKLYKSDYKYKRRSLQTLLNNWYGEIDKARAYFNERSNRPEHRGEVEEVESIRIEA